MFEDILRGKYPIGLECGGVARYASACNIKIV